jgi:hypothetical protein
MNQGMPLVTNNIGEVRAVHIPDSSLTMLNNTW